jgi:site-specific DNA-methyltransferase (adenine-specific)
VKIGNGTFLLGDCFEQMRSIPDGSVDMVLTDVPYNEVNRASGGLRELDRGVADNALFSVEELCSELMRVCSGSFYVFCGTLQISEITQHFKRAGLTTRVGAWHKTNPSPMNGSKMWLSGLEFCVFARPPKATFNEHCKAALWTQATQPGKDHPTQKPVALFERLIRASSSAGRTVFDPFAGSGTTAIAAENSGRRWLCIERDEGYYAKATARVQAHVDADPLR